MRLLRHLVFFALVQTIALSTWAMNNADVIKLKQADFSDETIIASINKEPADYDTSANGLIELKNAGISEPIIQKILARVSSTSAKVEPSQSASVAQVSELMSVDSPSIAPAVIAPVVGTEYFTRYSFHEEGDRYPITNYARGPLVPINTKVKIEKMSGKKMTLRRVDTGTTITVENIPEYSGKDIAGVAAIMLAAEETPVDRLVPALAKAIREGELRKGMTKEQALMARGYPPVHETPSLDGDKWVYWSSRFVKLTVVFGNGRLIDGRGIY